MYSLLQNKQFLTTLLFLNLYVLFTYSIKTVENKFKRCIWITTCIVVSSRYIETTSTFDILFMAASILTLINGFFHGMIVLVSVVEWFQEMDSKPSKQHFFWIVVIIAMFLILEIIKHSNYFALHKGGSP